MAKQIRIRAPASSANLGPGFDCLGLGLSLYQRLEVCERPERGLEIRFSGEGTGRVPLDESNRIYQAMERVFKASGFRPSGLLLESHNEIPLACGLGSSAAATMSGLVAGMLLCGRELDEGSLLKLGSEEEGHADNVAPCMLGGFTVTSGSGEEMEYLRLDPPARLRAVVALPDFSLPTQQARAVLPRKVTFQDAVANQGRVALLTAALARNRLELLRSAMVDRLHQPYRSGLVPGLEDVCRAALGAGALGAALSGAGPAVLAFVDGEDRGAGAAMEEAWSRRGINSRSLVLPLDRSGLEVEIAGEKDGDETN